MFLFGSWLMLLVVGWDSEGLTQKPSSTPRIQLQEQHPIISLVHLRPNSETSESFSQRKEKTNSETGPPLDLLQPMPESSGGEVWNETKRQWPGELREVGGWMD